MPGAQAAVLGTKSADETTYDHEIGSKDESGADNRRRDPKLKVWGFSHSFPLKESDLLHQEWVLGIGVLATP